MAIFTNTLKNEINSLTRIFNKKETILANNIYIYLPILSNFLIEKTFKLDKKLQNKDDLYLKNINKDNFLLEINLTDEKIQNTPEYIINKKININTLDNLQVIINNNLTENIDIFNNLKLKNNIPRFLNTCKNAKEEHNIYYNFLQLNNRLVQLLNSIFLNTTSVTNKVIHPNNNLLISSSD